MTDVGYEVFDMWDIAGCRFVFSWSVSTADLGASGASDMGEFLWSNEVF